MPTTRAHVQELRNNTTICDTSSVTYTLKKKRKILKEGTR